jgi:hypothetical protein
MTETTDTLALLSILREREVHCRLASSITIYSRTILEWVVVW